jgi:hypothetical protein
MNVVSLNRSPPRRDHGNVFPKGMPLTKSYFETLSEMPEYPVTT